MNKREVLLIVVAIIVVAVVGLIFHKRQSIYLPGSNESSKTVYPPGTSATRAPLTEDIEVPEADATDLPENIAAPTLVAEAAPSVEYAYRSFDIAVENGVFVPDTIIVREKDTVHLNITASDKTYDFYQPDYGLATQLPAGQKKVVEFGGLLTGRLTFYCQSCGGPEQGPVGYVVVVPREE